MQIRWSFETLAEVLPLFKELYFSSIIIELVRKAKRSHFGAVLSKKKGSVIKVNTFVHRQVHEMLIFIALSSNESSGESAHLRRLARAFAACIHKVMVMKKTQT